MNEPEGRGGAPESRALTPREVRELLASSVAPDPEVARRVLSPAFRLAGDRSLLVSDNGKGRLYESRTALLAMMDAITSQPRRSSTAGALPEGREFAARAGELAAGLGVAGLAELDAVVRRLGQRECLAPPVFSQLVAYAGEAIRDGLGGRWQMRLASDGTTWEPWLVDAAGREHAPFALVYKELLEWGEESSLTGVVRGELASFRE